MSTISEKNNGSKAVAVYCGSALGKNKAYQSAAISLGEALLAADRPLIYGGGTVGMMGAVSLTVLKGGGKVVGVIPSAMIAGGGEGVNHKDNGLTPHEYGGGKVETIVVKSMHERKVEMAKRVCAFFGLPGGYGTFEEVLEVTTWTQLGIHNKPVLVLNVLSYWDPLRRLVQNAVQAGFIKPQNERLIIFVDGPPEHALHESYDWGRAALQALEDWERNPLKIQPLFDRAEWSEPSLSQT